MKPALLLVVALLALTIVLIIGGESEDDIEGTRSEPAANAPQPAQSMARVSPTRSGRAQPPMRRVRMRVVPERIDPSALRRIERADGAVGIVLPNGRVWHGLEELIAGPERQDVLPTLDLLNRFPTVADRFQQSLKTEALGDCRTARRKRQGIVEAEIDWTMTVRASVRDGKFKVDEVSSDTWPEAFDREFYDCLSKVLAAASWEPSDNLSEIAFEYPLCQKAPPEVVDGRNANPGSSTR